MIGFPLFLIVQGIHGLCLLFDHLLFPSFSAIEIKDPVFVLGIPRSGTTFLHGASPKTASDSLLFRLESDSCPLDHPTESSPLRNPRGPRDQQPNPPFRRSSAQCQRGRFQTSMRSGSAQPRRLPLLLPVGGCFILIMAFPFAQELQDLAALDRMPQSTREPLIHLYRSILQRHLYCHPNKTLLSKNAAFATWGSAFSTTIPSAKFLLCIREPVSALSSQVSSLTPARSAFGTDPSGRFTSELFVQFYEHFYESLADFSDQSSMSQAVIIAQTDLKSATAATIRDALERIEVPITARMMNVLQDSARTPSGSHRHNPENFSLDSETIKRSMQHHFEAMMHSPKRSNS